MKRLGMFFRIIAKALWSSPAKALSSMGALAVGATLSSAFLSLYFVLPAKMSTEFRTLGPNMVLSARHADATFPEEFYSRLTSRQSDVASAPWLYAIGKVAGEDIVLAGTDLAQLALLNPGWKFSGGDLQTSAQSLLAGEKVVARFGWKIGQAVDVAYGGQTASLPLQGVISTGGSEDSQVILPLAVLQRLTSQAGKLSLIQVRASGSAAEIEATWQKIAALLPELDVRPLRQVIESEALVVMKVRNLMYGLTAVVLCIVILSVMTTVSGLVLDRQRDIGVMKTLGGSDLMISSLLAAETAVSSLLAAAFGYLIGFGLAEWAAQHVFHSSLPWRWDVLAVVTAVTLAVGQAATAFPIRLVRRLQPAVILKGS